MVEIPLGRMDRTSKGPEACGELSVCTIVLSQVARAPEDVTGGVPLWRYSWVMNVPLTPCYSNQDL